jgi:hypothetical protein
MFVTSEFYVEWILLAVHKAENRNTAAVVTVRVAATSSSGQ